MLLRTGLYQRVLDVRRIRVAPFWKKVIEPVYHSLWIPSYNSIVPVDTGMGPHFEVMRFAGHPNSNAVTIALDGTRCVFIDPGVRTFLTFYSPDGLCGKIGGASFTSRVHDLIHTAQLEELDAEVIDMHARACHFLCMQFDVIFLPRFDVPITKTPGSRTMVHMHAAFRSRLVDYARQCHKLVLDVPEHYTTQTCGLCGTCSKVGTSHVHVCPACGCVVDRDLNAARNICLLAITAAIDLKASIYSGLVKVVP